MGEQLLSVKGVAEKFNISEPTVYRWLKTDKLIGRKVGGQWRFDADAVQQAFLGGELSAGIDSPQKNDDAFEKKPIPDWANPTLSKWSLMVREYIDRLKPKHVVVNDRRGAKIWELIADSDFKYGIDLWHSTAIDFMSPSELSKIFAKKKVLLFDEMMQYGREMHNLREKLQTLKSSVDSLVCIRRKKHMESGTSIEHKSYAFENLDDLEFSNKAAMISRLMDFFDPPLDVGHLIVRGKYFGGDDYSILLKKLANWGLPFVIRYPNKEHKFLTVTLDRPQFFDTSTIKISENINLSWDGPCKIRFYFNTENNNCYFSFIVYPGLETPSDELIRFNNQSTEFEKTRDFFPHSENDNRNVQYEIIYEKICFDLSIALLNDFIDCGVPQDIDIRVNKSIHKEDVRHLKALFGIRKGKEIESKINKILSKTSDTLLLLRKNTKIPPPLLLRGYHVSDDFNFKSHDVSICRVEALKVIPQKYSSHGSKNIQLSLISYKQLLNDLHSFSESTIGKVIDYGLDWGIIKPSSQVSDVLFEAGEEKIKIERCFGRGEFGPWFEKGKNTISYHDSVMQKTLAIGPVALKAFLKWYKMDFVTLTIFHKIFSNLQHDWSEQSDGLFLGWRPYKFGPIPIWPSISGMGHYLDFKTILLDQQCIEETKRTKERNYKLYRPKISALPSWEKMFKRRVDPFSRVNIASLTRLYARIQKTIETQKLISPYSDKKMIKQDALIVLSAARNERIAYICAHWELMDWIRIGKDKILPQLDYITFMDGIPKDHYLVPFLNQFQAPVRLLFEKIEMYRNIGQLYKGIEILKEKENIEIAEVLLDRVDQKPIFKDDGDYPIATLQWFSKVMFSYTFFLRQIMNNFNLDIEQRLDIEQQSQNGKIFDADYYLDELLTYMPELLSIQKPLRECIILSKKKKYDAIVSKTMSNTFRLIIKTIETQNRMPDPQSEANKKAALDAWEGTIILLREIPINKAPYAIAVADTKNLINLPKIASDIFEIDYDDAIMGLLNYVKKAAKIAVDKFNSVHIAGFLNDNVFIYGRNPDDVYSCIKELINNTTQQISKAEEALKHFGLMRVGIAWKEDVKGEESKGIMPGILALKIGDKSGLKPGAVSITQEIFERLSEENQAEFNPTGANTEQGKLFVNFITLEPK